MIRMVRLQQKGPVQPPPHPSRDSAGDAGCGRRHDNFKHEQHKQKSTKTTTHKAANPNHKPRKTDRSLTGPPHQLMTTKALLNMLKQGGQRKKQGRYFELTTWKRREKKRKEKKRGQAGQPGANSWQL